MQRPTEIKIDAFQSIYPIFDKIIKTTVLKHESLITDFKGDIFSLDNIKAIIEIKPDTNSDSFDNKIQKQIETIEDAKKDVCKHIITNLLYLRDLPNDGISRKRKEERINPFGLHLKKDPFGMEKAQKKAEKNELKALFPINGVASYRTDSSTYNDFVELLLLYEYLLINSNEKDTTEKIREKIKDWILDKNNDRTNSYNNYKKEHTDIELKTDSHPPIDHMLLNLCDPDKYSAIANMGVKQKIVQGLYKLYVKKDPDPITLESFGEIDTLLKEINDEIQGNKDIWSHNLWEEPYRSQWDGSYVANAYEILTKYQKQVILYGAPGTGKTYAAEQIIKEFIYDAENNGRPIDINKDKLDKYKYTDNYDWTIDNSKDSKTSDIENVELVDSLKDKKVIWEMVQFNQSYSYEDFIEGLRPTGQSGSLKIVHGIFKRFATVAKKYAAEDENHKTFIFIIDEINRGKIDKIFGELLYLLEYRDKNLRLHYSNEEFSIPDNVYIIGTMNTADKSIALLDVALRRRFWFVRCAPKREVLCEMFCVGYDDELKISADDEPENIKKLAIKLFDWLNGKENAKGKLDELGSDADELKIGHSYFLKLAKNDITFSDLKNIWFYSVVPLIEEYCGFDKNRVEELLKMGNNNNLSQKEHFKLDKLQGTWK